MVSTIVKPFRIKGKLCPPRHGRVFDRTRLFQVLDEMSDMAGVWIHGPPGIGKTTLVTTYLDAQNKRCLWLQLDAGDSDPAVFLKLLNFAANDANRAQDASLAAPADDDLCDVPQLYKRRFQRLVDAFTSPWVLILDNVQLLGNASPLHAALAAVLNTLPAGMQIICVSRDPPPSPFGVTIASQQLGIIDFDKLRFTLPETGELVALHCPGSPVDELHRLAASYHCVNGRCGQRKRAGRGFACQPDSARRAIDGRAAWRQPENHAGHHRVIPAVEWSTHAAGTGHAEAGSTV